MRRDLFVLSGGTTAKLEERTERDKGHGSPDLISVSLNGAGVINHFLNRFA